MRTFLWATLGLLWLAAVTLGLLGVTAYDSAPSPAEASGQKWPAASSLQRDAEKVTLLLFAHPHCPCTRATLAELERVLAHPAHRPRVYILFVRPEGTPAGWEQTNLWRDATTQPGVTVRVDEDGQEARRFGAVASGHALLYNTQGALVFSGGITAARGHEGDNLGTDALSAALDANVSTPQLAPHRTPVFGCALLSSEK